nr:hypothetical protein [Tanacetum cinerariifolium]
MQDDLLNQMRNFIQNFQNGPPGEDKEHEATTDMELFSTEDIQPLPDDLLNQMRSFMQIFHDRPPGEDKETEATTDTKLPSTKDIQPLKVQKPPQDSNIRRLIREECCVEVPEQQKQKMKDTMLELVKICQQKEFLCIHDDVDDVIKSALDSKLLLINSNYQRLDKKEQEIKIVVEQPAERGNQDEIECDMPAKDVFSPVYTTISNPLFKDNDDLDSSDDESLPDEDVPAEEFKIYSNPLCDEDKINSDKLDPYCFNLESEFEEIRLIENLLYDNSSPRPLEELNAEIADTIMESIPLLPIPVQDGNSQQEEIDIVTETHDVLSPNDDNDDDLSNDLLLGEADYFILNDSIPPGIENVADDPEGDVRFLKELLINDSILCHESYGSNFEDNPSISRPPQNRLMLKLM